MGRTRFGNTIGAISVGFAVALPAGALAQVTAPRVENVPIPPNVDPFGLSFEEFKKYSSIKNFELIGQSYFKVPEPANMPAKARSLPSNRASFAPGAARRSRSCSRTTTRSATT